MSEVKWVKVAHKGVDISYNEDSNLWQFTLRGRERSALSLAKAKEAIDAPVKEAKPAFTKVQAYQWDPFASLPKIVTVTSVAETTSYDYTSKKSLNDLWVVTDGDRRKVSARNVYAFNESNQATLAVLQKVDAEMEALKQKKNELRESLQRLVVEVPE